ncbi:4a8bab2f-3030-4c8e-b008-82b0b8bc15d8 [Sclerotinia trifoliorum]|uniref:4a8bab2f-3030-4c8e-b008-82b0b8bc15d8 n=1 Tax=Sclerotinia trifoliorum TaxID=28548 RepID=A0A8H2ZNJ0_9HELO|nr:4a8bab2f-3030-4c8e-b008-82b0b8bc15d8 [Sclerotinia trifoliorum]
MSSNNNVPTNPEGWKQYSESDSLPTLPQKSSVGVNGFKYVKRDIYVDVPTVLASAASARQISIYADVLAFPSPNINIAVPKFGIIKFITRVVSASGPLLITLSPAANEQSAFLIYGSTFDQPISFKVGSDPPVSLNLSPDLGNLGAKIILNNGVATLTYLSRYVDLSISDVEFNKCLSTQIRIASILFWLKPAIALSLASHVARATASSLTGALLNLQAHALGQQISASALTGPNMNYAPSLSLGLYKIVLDNAIATTLAFETQYNRFSDRQAQIADQKLAWKAMLDRENDAVTVQQTLVSNALARWDSATDILNNAENTMQFHQIVLKEKEILFSSGIEQWKFRQIEKAIFDVFKAVIGFSIAIGELAIGNPTGAAAAPAAAASAVTTIAKAASATNALIKPDTLKALKGGTEAIFKLWDSTNAIVTEVRAQSTRVPSSINLNPAGGDVSGDDKGSADLTSIVSLAAWDDWMLQADSQLSFAIAQNIGGASAYQLELRRHAIDGKLLTQARAQSVKLGQEYLQLWLQLHATQTNAARLQQLFDTYQDEEDIALEAQSYFYDRVLMLRTSIMIYMRDAVWAYKYYTLNDSSITLDPLKSILEYQQDSNMIVQEVTISKERYSSDVTTFIPTTLTTDLPLDYATIVVTALQSPSNSVVITLSPEILNNDPSSQNLPPITGPFTDGSMFRVSGMRAFLLGAVPHTYTNNTALVRLTISTSGVYADVKDNTVYGFTIKPLNRPFEYLMARDGTASLPPIKDSIIKSQDYVDPTPFAQWTVKILNPQDFDLTGLTGLKLYWEGSAHFNAH